MQQSKCRETEASSNFALKAIAQDLGEEEENDSESQEQEEDAADELEKPFSCQIRLESIRANVAPNVSPKGRASAANFLLKEKKEHSSVMVRRWTKHFHDKLPFVDQFALSRGRKNLQHAAEFSQAAYMSMLRAESCPGQYFKLPSCQFKEMDLSGGRQTMVQLIEEITLIKGYKELTVYLAVSIADRYLAELAKNGLLAPPIVNLGVVSLLLAVKMNEPIGPNFSNMVHLISSKQSGSQGLRVSDLTSLERHILVTLDFNLQAETSINFIERFIQLFLLDGGLRTEPSI